MVGGTTILRKGVMLRYDGLSVKYYASLDLRSGAFCLPIVPMIRSRLAWTKSVLKD